MVIVLESSLRLANLNKEIIVFDYINSHRTEGTIWELKRAELYVSNGEFKLWSFESAAKDEEEVNQMEME